MLWLPTAPIAANEKTLLSKTICVRFIGGIPLMKNFVPLPRSFYQPSARTVAPRLLGHWLIRNLPGGPCGGPIVEAEAYLADDPASHGYGGESTRNRAMYGPPGRAYVYLIYGFHCCVNAVCRPAGCAEAVLIRAIEAELGLDLMRQNRQAPAIFSLCNGPGKLCQALAIDRKLDNADLCDAASPVFIAKNPGAGRFRGQRGPVVVSRRIGISRAADRPLRFHLDRSAFLSRPARAGAE
jgi:DNA-3-methyladenine glycosylase